MAQHSTSRKRRRWLIRQERQLALEGRSPDKTDWGTTKDVVPIVDRVRARPNAPHITAPTALVCRSTPAKLVATPATLLKLKAYLQTDEERERFIALAKRSLRGHACGRDCPCDELRAAVGLVLDRLAITTGVTPWLPDPRHQVPGAAYAGKSQR